MRRAVARTAALVVGLVSLSALTAAQQKVTVPAGTRLLVRMVESVDSSKQKRDIALPPAWRRISNSMTRWLRQEAHQFMVGLPLPKKLAVCQAVANWSSERGRENALQAKAAQENFILTEDQGRVLERAREKERVGISSAPCQHPPSEH